MTAAATPTQPGNSSTSFAREIRLSLRLAIPLIIGQVTQMLMGVVDTLMIGRVGVTELAASAFANTLVYPPMMVGIGMAMGVSIRVSQARGADNRPAARAALRHGLQIAIGIGLLILLGMWLLIPGLGLFRQPEGVTRIVPGYLLWIAASMVPALAGITVKNHADAMNRPWPVFWISVGSVAANAMLNWIFIFGHLGVPQLGLTGAGIGTFLARFLAVVAMITWGLRTPEFRPWLPRRWFRLPDPEPFRDLLRVGFPASMQLLAEVSAFVFATLLVGTLGEIALASHQIALSCASTMFMVPLGISMALTVRMGEVTGSGQAWRQRPIVLGGWAMGGGYAVLSALAFLIFREHIAAWFIQDPTTIHVAAGILIVAGAFQCSDAMQIISVGSLRGLEDVKIPAWIAFGAYWGVAIPLAWWWALGLDWGVQGAWWGITAGLTVNALAQGRRVWRSTGLRAKTSEV